MASVAEIAPDVFRISSFVPELGIGFNQFLVRDAEPLLYHTGFRRLFPDTLAAVSTLIDPARLKWIGYSHFEPDECGALNEWLAVAPQATAIASFVGVNAMLNDYADRPARAMSEAETLQTGKKRYRFISTPHLPHGWDASFLFEETDQTLFCSDLFFQPGETDASTESDIIGLVGDVMKASLNGPFAHDLPYTPQTQIELLKLAALKPRTLATMHGASYRGDGAKALNDFAGIAKDVLGGNFS